VCNHHGGTDGCGTVCFLLHPPNRHCSSVIHCCRCCLSCYRPWQSRLQYRDEILWILWWSMRLDCPVSPSLHRLTLKLSSMCIINANQFDDGSCASQRVLIRTNVNSTLDDGNRCWHSAMMPNHLLDLTCRLDIARIWHSMRDDGRFQCHHCLVAE
jgi:hypothetical protein